jgi:phosphate transport system substrate-binding protein
MKTTTAAFAALAIGLAACGGGNHDGGGSGATAATTAGAQLGGTLNGAGATFPQPVYQEWASRFQKQTGTTVNYQGIGSGGGIAQFTAGTVDFGASDAAMTDEEEAAAAKKGAPVSSSSLRAESLPANWMPPAMNCSRPPPDPTGS